MIRRPEGYARDGPSLKGNDQEKLKKRPAAIADQCRPLTP
jgi:hypothetical protein